LQKPFTNHTFFWIITAIGSVSVSFRDSPLSLANRLCVQQAKYYR
jgi:hypothetical protein